MEQDRVVVPDVEGWDDHRAPLDQVGDMAHESLVEDRIDDGAIVYGFLRQTPNPVDGA